MPIGFTIACLVALAILLYAELSDEHGVRFIAKPTASIAFILVAVTGGALDHGPYGTWVVIGLVLGAVGDVALMSRHKRGFLAGLIAFLLGHLAYIVAFATLVPIAEWPGVHVVALTPVVVAITAWLWPHLGPMRGPVLAYIAIISAMMIGAIAVICADPVAGGALTERAAWLLVIGAGAFFVSDLAVARQRFVAPSIVNRLWGLPTYYTGQLLIAWSAL